MPSTGAIRVVIAKPGLDGHDRGAKVVARALRDAGVEVIYTGLHQTPEQIVATAIQEDADAVGLSVLSGAHMTLFQRVIELLAEQDASDIVVFGGGIIPEADMPLLRDMGVAQVFRPGATTYEIVDWVNANLGGNATHGDSDSGSDTGSGTDTVSGTDTGRGSHTASDADSNSDSAGNGAALGAEQPA